MADFGLMFYNARWYDPTIGRFIQADTVVPVGVQGYDRYAYANNAPTVYNDPSGHDVCDEDGNCHGRYKYRAHNRTDYWNAPKHDGNRKQHGCAGNGVCNAAIKGLQIASTLVDTGGLLISMGEAGIADAGYAAAGVMSILYPGSALELIGGALELDYSVAAGLDSIENTLGIVSWGLTATADGLAGNTYISQSGDVHVGNSTLLSGATALAGLIPESNIDLAASLVQVVGDVNSLMGYDAGSTNVSDLFRRHFP